MIYRLLLQKMLTFRNKFDIKMMDIFKISQHAREYGGQKGDLKWPVQKNAMRIVA